MATGSDEAAATRQGIVPYVVAGCMFMENLDATAIVTALPAMARAFGIDAAALGIGISTYLVAGAVTLPLAPWLADRFGTRRIMIAGIAGFVLASMLCGISNGLAMFVVARIAQGAAAALMSPVGRLVVMRDAPKTAIVHLVAILTWPALIAPILGPPVGGLLTDVASWRWIFFLNLPIGLIGLILVARVVPQRTAERGRRFDRLGFLLYAAGLAVGLTGLELIGSHRPLVGALALAAGGAIGFLAYRHMRRADEPLVNLAPLAIQSFAISSIGAGTLSRMAISATPFLLPLLFQLQRGLSPAAAGSLTLIYFAGNLAMKLFTTRLLRRFGFRPILILNGTLVALTVAACAAAASPLPVPLIGLILFASGATRSLQFTALNTLTFADIPPALTGDAGTLSTLAQQIGMALGVAVASTLLGVARGVIGPGGTTGTDFAFVFACLAALGLAAVPRYLRLPHAIGAETSGKAVR